MNTPNKITIARTILPFFFVFAFLAESKTGKITALIIAILIELTDWLDGFLARKNKNITDFGKLMDPFADSFARLTIYFTFSAAQLVPVWMVIILLARDLSNAAIRTLAATKGKVVAARTSGKIKAVVQGIGIFTILLSVIFQTQYNLPINTIAYTTMVIVATITAISGIDYISGNWKLLKTITK